MGLNWKRNQNDVSNWGGCQERTSTRGLNEEGEETKGGWAAKQDIATQTKGDDAAELENSQSVGRGEGDGEEEKRGRGEEEKRRRGEGEKVQNGFRDSGSSGYVVGLFRLCPERAGARDADFLQRATAIFHNNTNSTRSPLEDTSTVSLDLCSPNSWPHVSPRSYPSTGSSRGATSHGHIFCHLASGAQILDQYINKCVSSRIVKTSYGKDRGNKHPELSPKRQGAASTLQSSEQENGVTNRGHTEPRSSPSMGVIWVTSWNRANEFPNLPGPGEILGPSTPYLLASSATKEGLYRDMSDHAFTSLHQPPWSCLIHTNKRTPVMQVTIFEAQVLNKDPFAGSANEFCAERSQENGWNRRVAWLLNSYSCLPTSGRFLLCRRNGYVVTYELLDPQLRGDHVQCAILGISRSIMREENPCILLQFEINSYFVSRSGSLPDRHTGSSYTIP
ncbi:hypothetical protein HYFRA_00007446 [Hymenoscyphus fraxineus]|uniref:Uncharacterized protein n=1 Tax=Hymenoscyphus fraxineus TaxID=746836 RepID=A0A9N9PPZ4_9HELO|nr:hypothetical protein HYFRA_00007446 [Hymenoscyphus fraxineus]